MPFRFGRGFGFRGSSPPWPYVGRGRGGFPRCAYPGSFADVPYGGPGGLQYYGGHPAYGVAQYAPPMSREEELDILQEEASAVKAHLDQIEARIKGLEGEKD